MELVLQQKTTSNFVFQQTVEKFIRIQYYSLFMMHTNNQVHQVRVYIICQLILANMYAVYQLEPGT